MNACRLLSTSLVVLVFTGGGLLRSQEVPAVRPADGVVQTQPTAEKPDPLKRPLSDKEKIKQRKNLGQELKGVYKKWVDEDVRWIITDQEMQAFKSLSNDEERDQFIEQFWLRRNPNPDSPENEFREQHYQRIAYANEHFAAGKAGWRTDRGHIYIAYGKPDSIDSHPSGGSYERPMEEGGGNTSTFPFETWHYRYLEGIGDNLDIEFVDTCMCGDYHMTIDRSEKDALKHVPGAGETLSEIIDRQAECERMGRPTAPIYKATYQQLIPAELIVRASCGGNPCAGPPPNGQGASPEVPLNRPAGSRPNPSAAPAPNGVEAE